MVYPKRSLGQNFLRSKKILGDIVRAGNVLPGETVLEVGPGLGSLTETLLATGAQVIAVEKDHRLIPILQKKFSSEIASGKLILIENDILDFDVSCSMLHVPCYKLIANIPYYITGALLRKFLGAEKQPSTMVILLQKEVAERIVARDKKESLLSISVKAYGEPRYVETVKAGNFSPTPKVDSAILAIENISKKNFDDCSEEKFFAIVKAGFAHKRKKLFGNLGLNKNEKKAISAKTGIGENSRAEDLTLSEWKSLVKISDYKTEP